jgi:hypothetical protein
MRVLLLAASDEDATTQLIKLALEARGIPYNIITVPTGAFTLVIFDFQSILKNNAIKALRFSSLTTTRHSTVELSLQIVLLDRLVLGEPQS